MTCCVISLKQGYSMEVESGNLVTENHKLTDQARNVQVLYDQKSHENAPSDEAMEKNLKCVTCTFQFLRKTTWDKHKEPKGWNTTTK